MSTDNDGLDFEFDVMDESSFAQSSLKKDPKLQEISRQSFRFPIEKFAAITIEIKGQQFDLINIVTQERTGLGIRLKGGEPFHLAQQLSDIAFKLDNIEFNVQGQVQHISPDGLGDYLCGIELIDLHPEDKQRLHAFVEKLREELFQEND